MDQGTAKPRSCLLPNPQLGAETCGAALPGGRRRRGVDILRSHGPHSNASFLGLLLGLGAWLSPRPCPGGAIPAGLWLSQGSAVKHARQWEPEAGTCPRARASPPPGSAPASPGCKVQDSASRGFGQSFRMRLSKTRGPKMASLKHFWSHGALAKRMAFTAAQECRSLMAAGSATNIPEQTMR